MTGRSRRAVRALGRAVVAVLILVVGGLGFTAARVVMVAGQDDPQRADALVVMGAAQFDGRPGPYLTARLEHALTLFQDDVAPRIVTVGGNQPGDRFTEASAARDWLVDRGVPEAEVVSVPRGGSTEASVVAVADQLAELDLDTAVVVTDPWHSLRSRTMMRDAGIETTSSPTTTGPSVGGAVAVAPYVGRETVALAAYRTSRFVLDTVPGWAGR